MPKSAASSPSACTPGVHPFPRRTTKAASGEHFASRPPDLHHDTAHAAASARRTLSQAGRGLGGAQLFLHFLVVTSRAPLGIARARRRGATVPSCASSPPGRYNWL